MRSNKQVKFVCLSETTEPDVLDIINKAARATDRKAHEVARMALKIGCKQLIELAETGKPQ